MPEAPDPESLLVPGYENVYRVSVCRVGRLLKVDLTAIHRLPAVVDRHLDRLALRGIIELPDEEHDDDAPDPIAFLLDPVQFVETAES